MRTWWLRNPSPLPTTITTYLPPHPLYPPPSPHTFHPIPSTHHHHHIPSTPSPLPTTITTYLPPHPLYPPPSPHTFHPIPSTHHHHHIPSTPSPLPTTITTYLPPHSLYPQPSPHIFHPHSHHHITTYTPSHPLYPSPFHPTTPSSPLSTHVPLLNLTQLQPFLQYCGGHIYSVSETGTRSSDTILVHKTVWIWVHIFFRGFSTGPGASRGSVQRQAGGRFSMHQVE